ncbi:MAG: phosphodiester glycosidase family protein [Clostridia bacterium]|nr:phosphodiester glycosidase family protein [Clostridia bacterium]
MKKCFMTLICLLLALSFACGASAEELAAYNSKTRKFTYVAFGRFPTEADGTERPIVWRVLSTDGQTAYLMSELILEARRVDPNCYPNNKDTQPYPGWENSELYAYLNGEFKDRAFSPAEQAALAENPDHGLVTLPSIEDLKNQKYGFVNAAARQAQSTAYAKANGLYVYQGKKQYSPYWSRTPSETRVYAHRRVMDDGNLGYISVQVENLGYRPAITLNLDKIASLTGTGTLDDPFTPVLTEAPAVDEAAETNDQEDAPEEIIGGADGPTEIFLAGDDEPAPQTEENKREEGKAFPTQYAEQFPVLTAEGFLPEGEPEFVYQDAEAGLYLYASQDLRIEIVRKNDLPKKNRPRRWLEADVYVRSGSGDFLQTYYHGDNLTLKNKKEAEILQIAKENHLVFAVNSDWYYYRVKRNAKKRVMSVGVILRQGDILYDDPAKKAGTTIPNRDILALFPDGNLRVYDYNGATAAELQTMGAYDVLSFGPVLLRDGEVTAQAAAISAHQSDNPRSGVGLVEKGHYVAILMEGRLPGTSVGCTLADFAELFQAKGCVSAYNLDGGGTASMMFMGQYLNQMGSYAADARKQIEVLGIGVSDQVN